MVQHRLRAIGAAAQQRADAGLELVNVEGLDQIVVRARIQPRDAVAGGVARGEDQHRHRVGGGAQALQHLQPVHARQAEVEHGEREVLVGERVQRARAVLHP